MTTKTTSTEKTKKGEKYWYYTYTRECVLCGYTEITRTRMYTPKPEDPFKRWDYEQFVCGYHFC